MRKLLFEKSELEQFLKEGRTKYEISEIKGCSTVTVISYMKRFSFSIPKGFHKKPKEQLVKKRKSSWTEERKKKHSKRMSGKKNPFYGKSHTNETKNKMSQNHADFSGDNNPFKKACKKDPELIKTASDSKLEYWSKKDSEERYQINKKNVFGEISKGFWTNVSNNAKSRNIDFEISPEYAWNLFLSQEGRCFLTGVKLNLKSIYEITASLDRIDSNRGYAKGNIQWLHKQINIMKNVYSNEDFISISYLIVKMDLEK